MAIKLYDAVPSSNSDRVKILLHEKRLPYERITLDLKKGEQKRPEFLTLNPYGKVPVIDDDGKILYESCIINEYLDEQYPDPPFMPKDAHRRGRVRVLTDYGMNYVTEPYTPLRLEMAKNERERDRNVIGESWKQVAVRLQYLEAALGTNPFFVGEISLVDIALVARFLRLWQWKFLPVKELPRLSGWLERMMARPSVQPFV